VVPFLGFAAVCVLLQVLGGAYVSDFAGYPDEAAHYVTGLMVRDYLAAFPWRAPMPFAEDFYRHYPMVALGHWPPLFYAVQGIWMLVFGSSRAAVLVLMAVISAAAASIVFHSSRSRIGTAAAAALALGFLATPIVQQYTGMVMAEMLVALLVLLAALAYRRYLDTGHWQDALRFGIVSAAAVLTKANGLALAFVPVGALLATRRFRLITRFSFWLPALIVLAICAPWYALTAEAARSGWSASYSPSWLLREPAWRNVMHLINIAGPVVFLFACVGMAIELRPRRSHAVNTDAAVMGALLMSVWAFHSFAAPVREPRHMITAVPPLLSFAVWGAAAIARWTGATSSVQRNAAAAFASLIAAVLLLTGIRGEQKPGMGSQSAVEHVLARVSVSDPVLVSSESYGEGVFIAELAGRERRPGHRVLRASKVLATSDWDGSSYASLDATTDALDTRLANLHVNVVIVDTGSPREAPVPHHRQLLDAVRNANRWRRLDVQRPESRFQIFEAVTR
jgi:4-amino-4-deoxy-L-arabinose transferase-like glycosyltransferase